MTIIDGKKIAQDIHEELKVQILNSSLKVKPCLAVILVGQHPASILYVSRKTQACEKVGILSKKLEFPETASEQEVLNALDELNQDPSVHGILVQLPLPPQISTLKILQKINPKKDVDGLHPENLGKLLSGVSGGFIPCTPLGIITLLQRSNITTAGKNALILGRSNLVGKPTAALLLQNNSTGNSTVTVAHSHTPNVELFTRQADILIAAIGKPHFIIEHMVKEGAVVIDVGINKPLGSSAKIVGDVDFENVKNKCSFITPVPGGVGPMTIAMLLSNTWTSFLKTQ